MEASSHVLTGKDPTHEAELRDTVANVKPEIDEGGKDSEDDEEEVERDQALSLCSYLLLLTTSFATA
jgi:hypothetical protein